MENLKIEERKSINCDLRKFDYLAKEGDFIEVTMWSNGEGVDVTINDKILSLTDGQLEAIKYLKDSIDYGII